MQELTDDAAVEREFWLRVIRRAQQEAEGRHIEKGENARNIKHQARKWLTRCTRGFLLICTLAGLNQQQIRVLLEQEQRKWGKVGSKDAIR